jgi:glycogen operon protein
MTLLGGSIALISTRVTRRVVEHTAQHRVDLVAGGQGLLQVHVPDHTAQHGRGDLLDRLDVVDDLVVGRSRVGDLEEQHGVDTHDQVVLGDHRLPLEGHHLLAEVDQRLDPVHERDDEVHPRLEGLAVPAETLDVARPRLRHDAHRLDHQGEHQHHNDDGDDQRGYSCFHDYSLG